MISLSRKRRRPPREKLLLLYHRRGARRAYRFTIFSGVGQATNTAHLVNHPQAIARVVARSMQRPSRIMIPTHWNLTQAEPRQMCEINQLHVKTEPINLCGFD